MTRQPLDLTSIPTIHSHYHLFESLTSAMMSGRAQGGSEKGRSYDVSPLDTSRFLIKDKRAGLIERPAAGGRATRCATTPS